MKLGFIFREATKGLGRNLTMTIAMIITTAIAVGLVVAGIMVTNLTKDTKEIYLDRVEVMVQLNEDISAGDQDCVTPACADLQGQLDADDSVESVEYRNRAESYERFASRWMTQAPFVLEAVLASFIGVVLGGAGIFLGKSQVVDPSLQGLYESQLLAPMKSGDLWIALPLVGLLALVVTAVTAHIALRSYVRK